MATFYFFFFFFKKTKLFFYILIITKANNFYFGISTSQRTVIFFQVLEYNVILMKSYNVVLNTKVKQIQLGSTHCPVNITAYELTKRDKRGGVWGGEPKI